MEDAAQIAGLKFFYGTGQEVANTISLNTGAKIVNYPALVLFNNYTENRGQFFTTVDTLTLLFLKPGVKPQGATSEINETKFNELQDNLTAVIHAFVKDSRVKGIVAKQFEHDITRLYTPISGELLCELRVNFLNMNFINNCI